MFLELVSLGNKCEEEIAESLTELFWELFSVIWVEELPNRNCFRINSVIILCAMVFREHFCYAVAMLGLGIIRARQKGDSKFQREKQDPERTFSQIFADIRLARSVNQGIWESQICEKPQETADFRRKPQKTADFCRDRFLPFVVSLLARS